MAMIRRIIWLALLCLVIAMAVLPLRKLVMWFGWL